MQHSWLDCSMHTSIQVQVDRFVPHLPWIVLTNNKEKKQQSYFVLPIWDDLEKADISGIDNIPQIDREDHVPKHYWEQQIVSGKKKSSFLGVFLEEKNEIPMIGKHYCEDHSVGY